jgi:DNA-binding XRE family transcriptional regulator
MSTRTTGRKGPAPDNPLSEINLLVRHLGEKAAKMARKNPPEASRDRFAEALRRVQTTISKALAQLRAVEPLVDGELADMPEPDAEGHYPAAETLRAIVARQIAERRHKANLSQAELAEKAGVRPETVSRLESGKHAPTVRTVEKIDRALAKVGV